MSSLAKDALSTDIAGLSQQVGVTLGPTEWTEMTQDLVNRFADVTGDFNFIHVDPERARATPFGGTIAHGFLTLSLVAGVTQRLTVTDAATSVNYGLDKVRFPAPLAVGARWRSRAEIAEVTQIKGGAQAKMIASVEVEGSERPAVVAECIVRFYS